MSTDFKDLRGISLSFAVGIVSRLVWIDVRLRLIHLVEGVLPAIPDFNGGMSGDAKAIGQVRTLFHTLSLTEANRLIILDLELQEFELKIAHSFHG